MSIKKLIGLDRRFHRLFCAAARVIKGFELHKLPKHIESVAILRLYSIGDSVLTLPLIYRLQKEYEVTVICSEYNKSVFEAYDINVNVEKFGLHLFRKIKQYSVAIDTTQYHILPAILANLLGKSSIGFNSSAKRSCYKICIELNEEEHIVKSFLKLGEPLGITCNGIEFPKPRIDRSYREFVREKLGKERGIAVNAYTPAICKRWPIERWKAVVDWLVKEGEKVILMGTKSAKDLYSGFPENEQIIHAYKYIDTVSHTIHWLLESKMLVSVDTGIVHIASSINLPTIALFGPANPIKYAPLAKGSIIIYRKMHCSPCYGKYGQLGACMYTGGIGICMKEIGVEDVISSIEKLRQ